MQKTFAIVATLAAAGTLVAARSSTAPTRIAAENDAEVVAIFDATNTYEIETAKLATERARGAEVKDFAKMLGDVHADVRDQARDLAKKLDITPMPPKDDKGPMEHTKAMTKLRSATAANFDRTFLEHEKDFHEKVVRDLRSKLIPDIKNQELKTYIQSLLPSLEGHRAAADSLLKRMGASDK